MTEAGTSTTRVRLADFSVAEDGDAVLKLMDQYCGDPMGDGKPLSDEARAGLIEGLRGHETTLVFVASRKTESIGIATCFRGFSTFAAKPLIYVSDFFVMPEYRGEGIGRALLAAVENHARAIGCCKITLEVQENNRRARAIYQTFGFRPAVYVPEAGPALSLTKKL